jgi:cystathionine beta-lyase
MERHRSSALEIARFLEGHPRVERVLHPGLPSFPGHDLARRQLSGWSGLFSFLLRGDPRRFAGALRLFRIGVSWGGFESLALPLSSLAPRDPSRDVRPDLPRNLIRLSIGLEDPRDLIADLERGLEASG